MNVLKPGDRSGERASVIQSRTELSFTKVEADDFYEFEEQEATWLEKTVCKLCYFVINKDYKGYQITKSHLFTIIYAHTSNHSPSNRELLALSAKVFIENSFA